jgi:hypothetical protein
MKDILLKTTRAGLVLLDLGLTLYLALEQRRARRTTEELRGAIDRLTAAVEAASEQQCEHRHAMGGGRTRPVSRNWLGLRWGEAPRGRMAQPHDAPRLSKGRGRPAVGHGPAGLGGASREPAATARMVGAVRLRPHTRTLGGRSWADRSNGALAYPLGMRCTRSVQVRQPEAPQPSRPGSLPKVGPTTTRRANVGHAQASPPRQRATGGVCQRSSSVLQPCPPCTVDAAPRRAVVAERALHAPHAMRSIPAIPALDDAFSCRNQVGGEGERRPAADLRGNRRAFDGAGTWTPTR